jgi:hypothetical protein
MANDDMNHSTIVNEFHHEAAVSLVGCSTNSTERCIDNDDEIHIPNFLAGATIDFDVSLFGVGNDEKSMERSMASSTMK